MLTHLPCGGYGDFPGPESDGMRIVCTVHRTWIRDRNGLLSFGFAGEGKHETRHYKYRDDPGCGAITDVPTGVRVIVGYVRTQETPAEAPGPASAEATTPATAETEAA